MEIILKIYGCLDRNDVFLPFGLRIINIEGTKILAMEKKEDFSLYSYKNFEVRYCLNRGENVGFEVLHKEDGSSEHRCLKEKECGENCKLMSGLPLGQPISVKRIYFR